VAFSAEQEKDIRKYMGVSFGFYDLNHRLESMMDLVGENATDKAQIETWLTRLAAIDTSLTGAGSSGSVATYGALKKVDEIEFYEPSDESGSSSSDSISLVDQGRTLIGRIARALGVSDYLPIGDYFGSRRPMGFTISLG
jgi:hypothetical protein